MVLQKMSCINCADAQDLQNQLKWSPKEKYARATTYTTTGNSNLINKDRFEISFYYRKNSERFKSNYWLSFMPYMGIMIDGVEDWLQAYNRSSKYKITAPTFKKRSNSSMEKCVLQSKCGAWSTMSYIKN